MRADHRPERAIESRPRPVTDANFWLESPVSGNTALLVLSVSCLATIEEVGVTLGPVGVPGVFGFWGVGGVVGTGPVMRSTR